MYSIIRAIFDALLFFVGSRVGKGKQAVDADDKREVLTKTGNRIREYLRLRGVQSSGVDKRGKSDQDRT